MVHCTRFKIKVGGVRLKEIKDLHALEISKAFLETYKCVHGFGFEGHFISLIPTERCLYLSYRHRDNLDEHRLFKFICIRDLYEENEIKHALSVIRKEYGHDHTNTEYDEDYQDLVDYIINS